jgi:two-component system OmpR family sensor kinase
VSIRLRLTLIYTIILALISIFFSVTIYFAPQRAVYRFSLDKLTERAKIVIQARSLSSDLTLSDPPIANDLDGGPDSSKFDIYYIQIRDLDGVISEPPDNVAVTLPLSSEAMQAVQNGEGWFELTTIDGERLAIYSRLFDGAEGNPEILQVAQSLVFLDDVQQEIKRFLFILNTVIIFAGFGIGWVMAGLALRPIHRITRTAQEIGAARDFSRRVDHRGPNDEVGQLATTVNGMLTELQSSYVQVEQSLHAQQRFVADASHELRTPLTTLRGNLGLLRRDPPISNEDKDDVLVDMVSETERLMRLTNDLLVLARADAQPPLKNEVIPVAATLADIVGQAKLLVPDRVVICRPCAEGDINGDKDALKQILLILLDNAIKYTPPDATITVSSQVADGQVIITVQDDGPGIEPERLPYVFDRFYRGDDARTEGGTGLGLSIAKELTEAQNGTITVSSTLGQGTLFTLTFPKEI